MSNPDYVAGEWAYEVTHSVSMDETGNTYDWLAGEAPFLPAMIDAEELRVRNLELIERLRQTDPESYELLFGARSGAEVLLRSRNDELAAAHERIATLEEALLKTWFRTTDDDLPEPEGWGECQLCRREAYRDSVKHTPDCIIPEILSRHGGNG